MSGSVKNERPVISPLMMLISLYYATKDGKKNRVNPHFSRAWTAEIL
jgi:hypothetical protein